MTNELLDQYHEQLREQIYLLELQGMALDNLKRKKKALDDDNRNLPNFVNINL